MANIIKGISAIADLARKAKNTKNKVKDATSLDNILGVSAQKLRRMSGLGMDPKKLEREKNRIAKSINNAQQKAQKLAKSAERGNKTSIKQLEKYKTLEAKRRKQYEKLEKEDQWIKNPKEAFKNTKTSKALKLLGKGGKYGLVGSIIGGLFSGAGELASNAMHNAQAEETIRKALGSHVKNTTKQLRNQIRHGIDVYGENSSISKLLLNADLTKAEMLDFLRNVFVICESKSGYNSKDLSSVIALMKADKDRIEYARNLELALKSSEGKKTFLKRYRKELEKVKSQRIKETIKSPNKLRNLTLGGKNSEIAKKLADANINTLKDLSETLEKLREFTNVNDTKGAEKLLKNISNYIADSNTSLGKFTKRMEQLSKSKDKDGNNIYTPLDFSGAKKNAVKDTVQEIKVLSKIEEKAEDVNIKLRAEFDKLYKYMDQTPNYHLLENTIGEQNKTIELMQEDIRRMRKALVDEQDTSIKHNENIKVVLNPNINVDNKSVDKRLEALEKAVESQSGGLMSIISSLLGLGAGMGAMYALMNSDLKDTEKALKENVPADEGSSDALYTALNLASLGMMLPAGSGAIKKARMKKLLQQRAENNALRRQRMMNNGYSSMDMNGKVNDIERSKPKPVKASETRANRWHSAGDTARRKMHLGADGKPLPKSLNYNNLNFNDGYNYDYGKNAGYNYNNAKAQNVKLNNTINKGNLNVSKNVAPKIDNSVINKSLKNMTKSIKTGGKSLAKAIPGLGAVLTVADLGLGVYDTFDRASSASTQAEKDKIVGEGLGRESVKVASIAAGALVGSIIPFAGTAAGAMIGAMAGDFLADSVVGDLAADVGANITKWSTDNDIMEELDAQGIIDYDYLGSSSIENRSAIMKLSKEQIKKLIDFDDFNKEDTEFLKYAYNVKIGKIEEFTKKKADELFSKISDDTKRIDDIIDKLADMKGDKGLVDAWNKLKSMQPDKVIGSKELAKIEKANPRIAGLIKAHALQEMRTRGLAKDHLGMSNDDIDKKYHLGVYNNGYLTSEVEVTKVEQRVQEMKESISKGECNLSDVSMDHMADMYDSDKGYKEFSDRISEMYAVDSSVQPRYNGNFSIIGGKKLNSQGNQVKGAYATKYSKYRGIRNNNPGNMRISKCEWEGKIPLQFNTDGSFEQFVLPEFGIRALAMNLKNYQAKYKLYTIRGMISKYAPSCENNTSSYIKNVCRAVGVQPNDVVDFRDPNVNYPMICAIIAQENGIQPYEKTLIQRAISAGLGIEQLTVDTKADTISATDYDASSLPDSTPSSPSVPMANAYTPTAELTAKAEELGSHVNPTGGHADLSRLNPAFADRLASATKEFEETYHSKLQITSGYRSDDDQARIYALWKAGDRGIRSAEKPASDVFFENGRELVDYDTGYRVVVGKTRINDQNISVEANGWRIRGGGHSAHNVGLAVDVNKSDINRFKPIAEKFGIWQRYGARDDVHFELRDGLQSKSQTFANITQNIPQPVKNVSETLQSVKSAVSTIETVSQSNANGNTNVNISTTNNEGSGLDSDEALTREALLKLNLVQDTEKLIEKLNENKK